MQFSDSTDRNSSLHCGSTRRILVGPEAVINLEWIIEQEMEKA